ncbi:MAG: Thymidylate kinase, partial [Candidatus Gottesmanbacteria bacterium GW2011_GWA1_34_13]
CDRYVDSSVAYQGYGRKIGAEEISKLNQLAINGAIPDLSIFLDISPELSLKRRLKSNKVKDRLDLQQKDFYERVYQGYKKIVKIHSNRYEVIDASKSIETVASLIWKRVKEELNKRN